MTHLQRSNDGRVCPRKISNWPITHSQKFHNRPVQPILISSLNPTQYVMALTRCDRISGAPRLRPNPGGMDCRTYPNRQFRADPIVDLGKPARKTRGEMTFENGHFFHRWLDGSLRSRFTQLHRAHGLTHAMPCVDMAIPLSQNRNSSEFIAQLNNPFQSKSTKFLTTHTLPQVCTPSIANF